MRGILAAVAFLGVSLGPVYAITINKVNVANGFTKSDNQKVYVYGLPALSLSSPSSAYTTKPFTALKAAPYPYSTSTNTLATFGYSVAGTYVNTGDYGTSTLSTVDPTAGLSISYWRWFISGTSLGSVPDPSVTRRVGPGSGGTSPSDWVSLNITFANTVKPRDYVDDGFGNQVFVGELQRPKAVLSYMDFGVGLYRQGLSRDQEVSIEQSLSQASTANINPRSQGNLAAPGSLVKGCKHGSGGGRWIALLPGRSCASEQSTTDFVTPVVPKPGDVGPIPSASNPVTAIYVSSVAGKDGVDPASTMKLQSSARSLQQITLGPGATLTIQVRVLLGAAHVPDMDPARVKLLFFSRMRELNVGSDVTQALFTAIADYPTYLTISNGATHTASAIQARSTIRGANIAPPASSEPGVAQDRQYWAHLLSLYNRSLRAVPETDSKLRSGRF